MDLLGGVGRDELRIFSWAAAAVFALVAGVWRPRGLHWTALGSALLFAALNAGAGIYVLGHFGDSRWSARGEPPLSAPSFSGTPVVGQFLGPLDSTLDGVVGGVNDFLAFKQALPVALDFLAASGWALLVSFPLAVLAAGISAGTRYAVARRRTADFEKYRATVDLLKVELEQVKRQISSGNSVDTELPALVEVTDVRPRLMHRG
ncbi:hypothetical protein LVY72_02965 [Arthrobacter sp. I2-34]|uniref:Uncharacterized protein n=1 Tax=Arthrobacter hankyongi TaxID=2904801 RepID=A0ABS9L301_9MICC|nr:hypothetical protein [Arthrobacter hankyongi]MCG2620872.1 hypothetical protein [Arthrobacter hankyongi]